LGEALGFITDACSLAVNESEYWFLRGQILGEMTRKVEGRESFGRAIALAPSQAAYQLAYADASADLGDHIVAIAAYRVATRLQPKNASAFFKLGDLQLLVHDYDGAEITFNALLKLMPGDKGARVCLGHALFGQKRWLDCVATLEGISRPIARASLELARSYGHLGRFVEARNVFERDSGMHAHEGEYVFFWACTHANIAAISKSQQDWKPALSLFEGLVDRGAVLGDLLPKAKLFYAIACLFGGRFERCGELLKELNDVIGEGSDFWSDFSYACGIYAARKNDRGNAMAVLKRIAAAGSSWRIASHALGTLSEQGSALEDATRYYQSAAVAPTKTHTEDASQFDDELKRRLGVVSAKAKRWKGAREILLQVSKHTDETSMYLGMALAKSGKYVDAFEAWRRLSDRFLSHPQVVQNRALGNYQLGLTAFDSGDYATAVTYWKQAYTLLPNEGLFSGSFAEASLRAAEAHILDGAADPGGVAARSYIEQARPLFPDDPRPDFYLALLLYLAGNYGEAAAICRKLCSASPSEGKFRMILALSAQARGEIDLPQLALSRMRDTAGQFSPVYQIALGNLNLAQGMFAQAFDNYSNALVTIRNPAAAIPAGKVMVVPASTTARGAPARLEGTAELVRSLVLCARRSRREREAVGLIAGFDTSGSAGIANWVWLLQAQAGDYDGAVSTLEVQRGGQDERRQIGEVYRTRATEVYLRRAALQVGLREYGRATSDAMRALDLDPTNVAARQLLEQLGDWHVAELLKRGELRDALVRLEKMMSRDPIDSRLMHHVAIVSQRLAFRSEMQHSQTDASQTARADVAAMDHYWRLAITCWAAVLSNHKYWDSWVVRRKAATKIQFASTDAQTAMNTVRERLTTQIRDFQETYRSANRLSDASRLEEYDTIWEMEVEVAELVGGFVAVSKVDGWPEGLACGPAKLTELGGNPVFSRGIENLHSAYVASRIEAAQKLRTYLLPTTGRYYFWLDHHKPQRVVELLEKARPELRNTPEANGLLARAYIALASDAISVDFGASLRYFEAARRTGADIGGFAKEIEDRCLEMKRAVQTPVNGSEKSLSRDFLDVIAAHELSRVLLGSRDNLDLSLTDLYKERAAVEHAFGKSDDAIKSFEAAVKVRPTDEQVQRQFVIFITNVAIELGEDKAKRPRAFSLIQKALPYRWALNDENLAAFIQQFCAFDHASDAVRYAEEAVQKRGRTAPLNVVLCLAYRNNGVDCANSGDFESAIRLINLALGIESTDEIRNLLSTVYVQYGIQSANASKHDQAIQLITKAMNLANTESVRTVLSQAYAARGGQKLQRGDQYGAKEDLRYAYKLNPSDAQLRDLVSRF
jgi:tetratricopeptide (TPR) repeat protein